MKSTFFKKFGLVLGLVLVAAIAGSAQDFDVAFGVGTLIATSASSASGNSKPVSLTGGAYPQAAIGWESLRFYQPFFNGSGFTGCSNFVSSNHFMGHFGGGLRYYFKGHFFVRPEAHVYLIRNNVEFSSPLATRVGVSLGYTF